MTEDTVVAPAVPPTSVVASKINDVLATSYASVQVGQAFAVMDKKISGNTLESRRSLKASLDDDVVRKNTLILREFSEAYSLVKQLGTKMESLERTYDSLELLVDNSSKRSISLVSEAQELMRQRNKVKSRQQLLSSFKESFIPHPKDIEAITEQGGTIDERFQDSLSHLRKIYEDCRTLLVNENTAAGMEIMSQTGNYLDLAYRRLALAIQKDLKTGNSIGSKNMRRQLESLSSRPDLLHEILSQFVISREQFIQKSFMEALTQMSGQSRPIDYYSFDSLRYVGDMLAWIHGAVVTEKELVLPIMEVAGEYSDRESAMAKICGAVVKPLRVRVEQVVASEIKAARVYQLSSTIRFYLSVFSPFFPTGSSLIECMKTLIEICLRRFYACLEDKISSIKSQLVPTIDLQPPEFLHESVSDAREVLTQQETSMAPFNNSDEPVDRISVNEIIENLVEPSLECCSRISSDIKSPNAEIFLINCLDFFKLALQFFPVASYKVTQLDRRIEDISEALVAMQFQMFVDQSKIAMKAETDQEVQNLVKSLDSFLPSATLESNLFLQKLASPRLASTITLRASLAFVERYEELLATNKKLSGVVRSLDEVRVLLAC